MTRTFFLEIVNGLEPLIIFAKSPILRCSVFFIINFEKSHPHLSGVEQINAGGKSILKATKNIFKNLPVQFSSSWKSFQSKRLTEHAGRICHYISHKKSKKTSTQPSKKTVSSCLTKNQVLNCKDLIEEEQPIEEKKNVQI